MNEITLSGFASSDAKFSHEIKGENFYKFELCCVRLSNTVDTLPCVISENIMPDIKFGIAIKVRGEVRTRNTNKGVEVSVFVLEVFPYQYTNENFVEMEAYICKKPTHRFTPLGREISDFIAASNRIYKKSDYIPCIAWGRNAIFASNLEVGTHIRLCGRLQSREYQKKIGEDEIETRTAYEVSVSQLELIED